MGFFSERKKIKSEAEQKVKEWEEESEQQYENIKQKYNKPSNPLSIKVLKNTYHIINGYYDVWCAKDKIVLESTFSGNLILTLREDWNKNILKELGFDSSQYSIMQVSKNDKREYELIFNNEDARFVEIPLEYIVSCTEKGDYSSSSVITSIEFKTSKKADVKSKTVTNDTRVGIISISEPGNRNYDIIVDYFSFEQLKQLINLNKKNVMKSNATYGNNNDSIEILKQLKELVDIGVLTKEEYEEKKKEVLRRI